MIWRNREWGVWGVMGALLLFPVAAFAAEEFVELVGIPGVDDSGDIESYLNNLYVLAITIAAVLAVLKLIGAGAKYMMSDVVPTKQAAKSDITGALLGLVIIIGAVTILNEINPNLTKLQFFDESNRAVLPDLPELPYIESDKEKEIREMCELDPDGCEVTPCTHFNTSESWWGSYLGGLTNNPLFWAGDWALTNSTCYVQCTYLGGIRQGNACAHPNNPEVVAAAQERIRQALIEEGKNHVATKFADVSTIDGFEGHYSNSELSIRAPSKDDVLGAYVPTQEESLSLETGEHEYTELFTEIVRQKCVDNGGSGIVSVLSNRGEQAGKTIYYCYR